MAKPSRSSQVVLAPLSSEEREPFLQNSPSEQHPTQSPLVFSDQPEVGVIFFCLHSKRRALTALQGDIESLLGEDPKYLRFDANLFLRHVHPDDRFSLTNELDKSIEERKPFITTYRWIRPDDSKTILLHCRASVTSVGSYTELFGMLMEISSIGSLVGSSLSQTPLSLAHILDALPGFSIVFSKDFVILERSSDASVFSACFDGTEYQKSFLERGSNFLSGFYDSGQQAYFSEPLRELMRGERTRWIWTRETASHTYKITIQPVENGSVPYALLFHLEDISKEASLRRQTERQQEEILEGTILLAKRRKLNGALQTLVGHLALMQEPLSLLASRDDTFQPLLESSKAALRQSWFAFEADTRNPRMVVFDEMVAEVMKQTRPLFRTATEWGCRLNVTSHPMSLSPSIRTTLIRFFSILAEAACDESRIEIHTYGGTPRQDAHHSVSISGSISPCGEQGYDEPLVTESLRQRLTAGLAFRDSELSLHFRRKKNPHSLEANLTFLLPVTPLSPKIEYENNASDELTPEIVVVGKRETFDSFQQYFERSSVNLRVLSPFPLQFSDLRILLEGGALVVMVDLDVLPKQSERTLLRAIRRFPDTRFLLLSGSTRLTFPLPAESDARWLQKPVTPSQLSYHLKRARLRKEFRPSEDTEREAVEGN
ncbi:MAG: PAS domain-containing protein [Bdellovibrionales bacterium]|nr:PAS domain-containing protein [Bdellovibrionales bacterium]